MLPGLGTPPPWLPRAIGPAVVTVAISGSVLAVLTRSVAILSLSVAAIALVLLLRMPAGSQVTRPAVGFALASIATTLLSRTLGQPDGAANLTIASAIAETLVMLLVIVLVVTKAPPGRSVVAVVLSVIAVGITVLRSPSADNTLTTALGCVLWGAAAVGAAGVGGYLRLSMARRASELLVARRAQRLQLAADLHDFVAHDVSEMLALAQAGQIVAESDAGRAADIFGNIEAAALHAMDSLDHTVKMLGDVDSDAADCTPRATITGLTDMVERFSRSSSARVALDIDPQISWAVRHRTSAALYRIVAEALTNVRRHAPNASVVRIEARQTGRDVELSVSDNGRPGHCGPAAIRSGGLGLPGLTARVAELGGTLTAGPEPTGGWRVVAKLPLAPRSGS